ncbi:YobI family P-loop NTPase [Flavobacterium mesophilum]|uniref:YobI family P-loop NTPase n=1 Tax=Flavobacterium mesophilum TaxID=3143495 RepID=UPI0031E3078A
MRKKILNKLEQIINWLERLHNKISLNDNANALYSSLSPIDNGDENGHYSKALLWALKNRKKEDIKNIALTGPYGSGKSSILKTFQKNYKGRDLKFLNISLATFAEEKPKCDKKGNKIKTDKNELLKLIEISILEQIFYHENDNKIPDSRFKKIKSYSFWQLFFYSLGYLILLISLFDYFNPYFIQSIIKDVAINNTLCDFIYYIERGIIAFGLFIIILKSSRLISSITINKLQIQNAEIGIGENLNKSILNHHIDELLYFFSARPYNVVIIEDLDRFEETEIFTKLRELNLLLNNSKKTKKKEIVFIYAIRDNMFTDKERTKFFDFIIPVIPVINSSNSNELLFKKRKSANFNLSDSLIEDMSFFIDDMRLLNNISNEFYLYKEKLNENLNQDKLFAIITYKNIYPTDFMKLSYNEGYLYDVFNSKNIYLKRVVNEKDIEITKNNEDIKYYESIYINNVKDLRRLYVSRIVEKLSGYKSFVINDETMSIEDVIKDENFEYLKNDNYKYHQMVIDAYGRDNTRVKSLEFHFRSIEKEINPSKLFLEQETEISDIQNGKINALKSRNQELEKQKQKTRSSKIGELLRSNANSEIPINENLNKNFILTLLRNGYIGEDYIDYISLFHEESISRSDYQFHINIKNETNQSFDYKLYKIEKLITKININDFQTEYILNYNLMDFLLANVSNYTQETENIINKLKDESKVSIEFIKGYCEFSEQIKVFTNLLSNKWPNIWNFIESNPDFSNELKKAFFKNIIEYSDIKDIQEISKQSSFKQNIISNPLFLNISDNCKQLKKIIETLQISFDKIDFDNSPDEMLSFIYENSFYKINTENIISIIKKFGEFNQIEFDNANFFAIRNSKADKLIGYIEKNPNEYLEKIFFNISTNVNEDEESFIELINHKNISHKNKEFIIEQVKTKISLISKISDYNLKTLLLTKNKVIPKWENLLHTYNTQDTDKEDLAKEIPDSIISYLNIIENAEELSKTKIPKNENNESIYKVFWKKLIQMDKIENRPYALISKSSPWWYKDLNLNILSEEKIKSLINNTCIQPVVESFNNVKEAHNGLNIYLFEKRKIEYFKILNELTFDSDDLELVLESTILNNSEKYQVLKNCPEDIIITNNNLKLLSSILIEENSFVVSDNILKSIITNNKVLVLERIKLFIKNSSKYNIEFIENFLKNLGGDYSDITDTKLKAKVPKNQENQELLSILKNKGYISSVSILDSHYRVNHKRK